MTSDELAFPLTNLNEVLTTTRSVRKRLDLDRPVDISVVGECLQLALQAPTGGAAEDWRWIVIDDPAIKTRIADYYLEAFKEHVLRPLAGDTGAENSEVKGRLGGIDAQGNLDPRTERILDGARHLATIIGRAPCLVLPCATRPNPAAGGPGQNSAVYGSLYPAIWSFNLALRARGLGTCFTTLHLYHAKEIADLLGIPSDVVQITLLPVAYTIGTNFKVAARKPVGTVSYLNTWGTPLPYDDRPFSQLSGEEPT